MEKCTRRLEFAPYNPMIHRQFMPRAAQPTVCEDTRGIVALKDGKPVAVCVLDSWSASSCQIHIWIGDPFVLKHGFAEEVFSFVFDSGRVKIIGVTPSDNEQALRFIKHIGFQEIYRVKDGYEVGVDYVVTEIHKDDCRYYGKQKRRA